MAVLRTKQPKGKRLKNELKKGKYIKHGFIAISEFRPKWEKTSNTLQGNGLVLRVQFPFCVNAKCRRRTRDAKSAYSKWGNVNTERTVTSSSTKCRLSKLTSRRLKNIGVFLFSGRFRDPFNV